MKTYEEYKEQVIKFTQTYGEIRTLSEKEWLISMFDFNVVNEYEQEYFRRFVYKSPSPEQLINKPVEGGTIEDGGAPTGRAVYELTLTATDDKPQELVDAFHHIISVKMFEIVKWKACIELTKNNIPHIHAILWTDKKFLDANKMKRYYDKRFELKKVRDVKAYLNYIFKEKDNIDIIEYCKKHSLPQFWNALPEKK